MPPTRFNPFSAPPSGVAHIDAHVGCYRWPPHPYNFPTLENGCAPKKKRDRRGEPATFTTGWYYIYIYMNIMCIYIYTYQKNVICMEQVNSSTMRFSGTLCSVSHPLAVTRQILRPDGSLVVTAHQVDGPIFIDPPQKFYALIIAFPGSITVSSKAHPFVHLPKNMSHQLNGLSNLQLSIQFVFNIYLGLSESRVPNKWCVIHK